MLVIINELLVASLLVSLVTGWLGMKESLTVRKLRIFGVY